MTIKPPPIIPPQLNTLTLKEGMDRTNYWRQAVKGLYGNNVNHIPHGFFIRMTDIHELNKIANYFPEYNFVGVRAYFTFHDPQPGPNGQFSDTVTAVLVPVYESMVEQQVNGSSVFVIQYLDFIQPVPEGSPLTEGTVTIYDVTQPCPTQCDSSSQLY
jgi:hypothetical protein